MSAMKEIFTELEELNVEVNFNNRDDLYDMAVDMRLAGVKLSLLMCKAILGSVEDNEFFDLMDSDEFVSAMEWHIG